MRGLMAINTSRLGRTSRALLLAVAVAAGVSVLVGTRPVEAAFPGANGKIVFASTLISHPGVNNPTGDYEIFTMNPDGTGLTQLTNNTTTIDWSPSFSADGDVVVFTSYRDNPNAPEIYIMDADGSNQFRLTDNTTYENNPTISPDRTKVAYESLRGGNFEIIVRFGGVETNLTNNAARDQSPAFSPDGSKIAFTSNRDGNSEVYVMDADGTDQTRLTNNAANDSGPDWSPNGNKIAFTRERTGNHEIFVMNALDGSGQQRLTRNAAVDGSPAWSPNGRKIAFSSDRDGDYEIFVMNKDGTKQTKRTNNPDLDEVPDWQPIVP